jgi:hypothetical protein
MDCYLHGYSGSPGGDCQGCKDEASGEADEKRARIAAAYRTAQIGTTSLGRPIYDNSRLYAGSPMHYDGVECGEPAGTLPEDHPGPSPTHCASCLLRNAGLGDVPAGC